jgi:hypothetical protein
MDDKRSAPASAAPPKRRRRYRIAEWVEETKTSRATTWRRIKDGTLQVAYYGNIPYIVDGPAEFFE